MTKRFLHIVFLFCSLVISQPAFSQLNEGEARYLESSVEGKEQFSEENIKKSRGKIDYSEDHLKKKKEKKKETKNRNIDPGLGSAVGGIVKFIFIALLIGILAAIIVNMLGGGNLFKPSSKKIKGSVSELDFDELEDNLQESELEKILKEAISKKEYKVAVRLYFLMIIRDLSEKKFIKWKKDKTNREYVRETGSLPFNFKFQEATNVFERIWYGEFNIESQDFANIQPKFQSLLQDIKNLNQ